MKEQWRDIEGFDGYQVSNLGNVRSFWQVGRCKKKINKPRLKSKSKHYKGYLYVSLLHDGVKKYVHRLVAEAFIPNPENKKYVNHIDENKTNNHVDNLEWVTAKENSAHSFLGERNTASKLKRNQVLEIKELLKTSDLTSSEIGVRYGVGKSAIKAIKAGRTWSHVIA